MLGPRFPRRGQPRAARRTFLTGWTANGVNYGGTPSLDVWKVTDRLGRIVNYSYDRNRQLISKSETVKVAGVDVTRTTGYAYYENGVLKNLTDDEMIEASGAFLAKDRKRPLLERIPLLAAMLPSITEAHDALLAGDKPTVDDGHDAERARLLDWLLAQQYRTVHPYTGAAPGGSRRTLRCPPREARFLGGGHVRCGAGRCRDPSARDLPHPGVHARGYPGER